MIRKEVILLLQYYVRVINIPLTVCERHYNT